MNFFLYFKNVYIFSVLFPFQWILIPQKGVGTSISTNVFPSSGFTTSNKISPTTSVSNTFVSVSHGHSVSSKVNTPAVPINRTSVTNSRYIINSTSVQPTTNYSITPTYSNAIDTQTKSTHRSALINHSTYAYTVYTQQVSRSINISYAQSSSFNPFQASSTRNVNYSVTTKSSNVGLTSTIASSPSTKILILNATEIAPDFSATKSISSWQASFRNSSVVEETSKLNKTVAASWRNIVVSSMEPCWVSYYINKTYSPSKEASILYPRPNVTKVAVQSSGSFAFSASTNIQISSSQTVWSTMSNASQLKVTSSSTDHTASSQASFAINVSLSQIWSSLFSSSKFLSVSTMKSASSFISSSDVFSLSSSISSLESSVMSIATSNLISSVKPLPSSSLSLVVTKVVTSTLITSHKLLQSSSAMSSSIVVSSTPVLRTSSSMNLLSSISSRAQLSTIFITPTPSASIGKSSSTVAQNIDVGGFRSKKRKRRDINSSFPDRTILPPLLHVDPELILSSTLSMCWVTYTTTLTTPPSSITADTSNNTTSTVRSEVSVTPASTIVVPATISPVNSDLKVSLSIDVSVNETSTDFRRSIEQKLLNVYVYLTSKRKRRAAIIANTSVEVLSTSRNGYLVCVIFKVKEQGVDVPSNQSVAVFNYLSTTGLQKKLGYQVNGPITAVTSTTPAPRYGPHNVVGMVVVDSQAANLSLVANRQLLKMNLSLYFNREHNITKSVTTEILFGKHEIGNQVYLEMYFVFGDIVQEASTIVSLMKQQNMSVVSKQIFQQIIGEPYVVNSPWENDLIYQVKMTFESTNQKIDQFFKNELALKLAMIYMIGEQTKRTRRAAGSVVAEIVQTNNANGQTQVVYVIIDKGVPVIASMSVPVMNSISSKEMTLVLGATVVKPPSSVMSKTETAALESPPYWIIAAIVGPVIFISLLCCFLMWCWKKNADNSGKVEPHLIEMDEIKPLESLGKDGKVIEADATDFYMEKQSMAVPLFSASNNNRTSTRRKVQPKSLVYEKANPLYEGDDDIEEESVEEEDDDDADDADEDEEDETEAKPIDMPVITRRRLELDYPKKAPSPLPRSPMNRPPIKQRTPSTDESARRPFEMTGNSLRDGDILQPVPKRYTASHIPTFGLMTESRGHTPAPPVRFRRNIDKINTASTLPSLGLKQTPLMAAPPIVEPIQRNTLDIDLKHKSDIERLRNKQRQRNQLHGGGSTRSIPVAAIRPNDKAWKEEQKKIDSVLDPEMATRKGRRRRRFRRKYKVHIAPDTVDGKASEARLRAYKKHDSRKQEPLSSSSVEQYNEADTPVDSSTAETDGSMREARHRIHALLDDTFSAIKKYQKNLLGDDASTQKPNDSLRRYAGMRPTVTAPAPSHGRASVPVTPNSQTKRKFAQNLFENRPYNTFASDTPFVEPMVTWDPAERQRFVNQRLGYPVYGHVPPSIALPYGSPGQSVYVTPVQQRPDMMGNMVWTPHVMDNTNQPVMNSNNSLGGEYLSHAPVSEFKTSPSTAIDVNNSNSQPLIRAIKEELLRLSNTANSKNRSLHDNIT